jgi:hypothetical protein
MIEYLFVRTLNAKDVKKMPRLTNRLLRFALVLVAALALVPFLPFYVLRTMRRSWRMDHAPDIIDWVWKFCTLGEFWSDYKYLLPEQRPALWLTLNLALAFTYALVIAFSVDLLLARWKRRQERFR